MYQRIAPDVKLGQGVRLAAFINLANDSTEQVVFVLDDYHLIDELTIHQTVTFLLDHLPATFHFLIAGRSEPPLPLARYRARRFAHFGRVADLRFYTRELADDEHRRASWMGERRDLPPHFALFARRTSNVFVPRIRCDEVTQ